MSPDNSTAAPHRVSPLDESLPKYFQLREIIRETLLELAPNQKIPSELEYCQMYNVSRTTVRKALDLLIFEGLLNRVPGKGTMVAPQKFRGKYVNTHLGFHEEMSSRGIEFQTRVLDLQIIPAPPKIAETLKLAPESTVFKLERLRLIDGEPTHLTTSYLPYRIFPGIEKVDFSKNSLFAVMRERYGIRIQQGVRLIEACLSSPEEAKLLNIKLEVPLLVMIGALSDINGAPIEYGITKFRSDRNQLEVAIT